MKNYLVILFFVFLASVGNVNAQGGGNCSAAAAAPVTLPFSASNQTNCGMGNAYTGANSVACGNTVYLDGEDILYAFTPTVSGLININVTSGSSWVGLFLYQGCPSGGTCVANSTSSLGNQSLSNIFVTAGVTYYVVVDKWVTPTCISNFTINISAPTPAPTPTVQDCLGAIAVCQNVYSEANAYSGTGNIPNEINSGPSCLGSGEKNDVWYTFTTQTAGNVCFTIDPNNNSDDYDWAVYDLTSNSCSDIYNNSALEVSCNYSGTSGNTGPNGLAGSQNEPCIPVQAGETYVVNVSQFSTSTNGYTINFGASTASIFDNVPPALQAINSSVTCGMSSMQFNFTENVVCNGILPSDFTLTGPGGPYTLSSVIGSNCNNGASQDRYFSISITPAIFEPGTYSFCMANTDSSIADLCGNYALPGCLTFDVVYPVALAGLDDTITCSNLIATLDGSASSVGTYNWLSIGGNIVSGQNSLTPQVNQTGLYILEVNTNDCISRDTLEIFQDSSLPTVLAGNDTTLTCVIDTIQLNGFVSGSNVVYYWTGPSILSGDSTLTPIVDAPGSYTLTAIDTVSNCQLSSTINVIEDRDLPYVDAGLNSNLTCVVSSVILNGSASVSGTGYTYQWTDSNGAVVADSIYGATTVPGIYTLTVFNTLNNCSATDFITVNIDTLLPITSAGADTSLNCSTLNTGVPVNGTGSQTGMTYLWSTSNGNIVAGGTSNFALVNAPGTYTLTVTNPANGCVNTDDVVVVIDTIKPIANAGADMVLNCYNPTVNLDGTASSAGGNITYQWTGSFISGGASTTTPSINGAGNYTLLVTNTSNMCTASDVTVVTSNFAAPGASAGMLDTICSGDTLLLSGTSGSGDIFMWTTTDGNIVSGDSTLTPSITSGGTYTLTTTNSSNGCQSTSNVFIQEYVVSAIISADPISGQMPLTVNLINLGVADSSYWDFANGQTYGDTSVTSTTSVIYETQGTYVVTLTSFNGQCSATTRITIEVFGTSFLIVPNVFTPNGDGKNDVFEFLSQNITELNCVIFNRWGKQVAELTSADQTWDGKNGSDGTYFYVLKAKGLDDVDYDLKGTITMIK
jgi:gliding motility-associated-like protein